MSRQPVDLVLTTLTLSGLNPKNRQAQQSAWLRATRIPLRSVSFWHCEVRQRASAELAVSQHMLAASTHTLEVTIALRPPSAVVERCVRTTACKSLFWRDGSPFAQTVHLDKSECSAQEIRNMIVPKPPGHLTTLARFPELRRLSLLGLKGLKPEQVCHMVSQTLCEHRCNAAWSINTSLGRSIIITSALSRLCMGGPMHVSMNDHISQ